jgi:hypothetical protein
MWGRLPPLPIAWSGAPSGSPPGERGRPDQAASSAGRRSSEAITVSRCEYGRRGLRTGTGHGVSIVTRAPGSSLNSPATLAASPAVAQ